MSLLGGAPVAREETRVWGQDLNVKAPGGRVHTPQHHPARQRLGEPCKTTAAAASSARTRMETCRWSRLPV